MAWIDRYCLRWPWYWLVRFQIWDCRMQLAIGEYCGMGVLYKTELRVSLAWLEQERDRLEVLEL